MEDTKPRSGSAKQPQAYIATEFGNVDGTASCTQKDVVLACGPTTRSDPYSEVDGVQPDTMTETPSNARGATKRTGMAPLPLRRWNGSLKICEGVGAEEGIKHGVVAEHKEEVGKYPMGEKYTKDKKKEDEVEGGVNKADMEGRMEKETEPEQQNDNADTGDSCSNDTEEGKVGVADMEPRMKRMTIDAPLEEREAVIGRVVKRVINREVVPDCEKYRIAEVLGTKDTIGFQLLVEATNFFRALSVLDELDDRSVVGEFITEERRRYGKQLTAEQIALILDAVAKQFNV